MHNPVGAGAGSSTKKWLDKEDHKVAPTRKLQAFPGLGFLSYNEKSTVPTVKFIMDPKFFVMSYHFPPGKLLLFTNLTVSRRLHNK